MRLVAICHDTTLQVGPFCLGSRRPLFVGYHGVRTILDTIESLLHLAAKPGVMLGRFVYLPLALSRIWSFPLDGSRIMVRHVDFEPGKAEFVANIGGRGVQIPPDPHAARPLGRHSPFVYPILDENGIAPRLTEHDSPIQGVCSGQIFDSFAINGLQ